ELSSEGSCESKLTPSLRLEGASFGLPSSALIASSNQVEAPEHGGETSLRRPGEAGHPGGSALEIPGGDEPGLIGQNDCLYAVAQPELAENMSDMRLGRVLADHEGVGDLGVR